jgi:HEPN domain-containing protein
VIILSDKVVYWIELCDDDLLTARTLFFSERYLHMGFFCHMIVEKALKAAIAAVTNSVPPKTHDLHRLANLGAIDSDLTESQLLLLDTLMPLQIEARYPELKAKLSSSLDKETCREILCETEAFLCWKKKRLSI